MIGLPRAFMVASEPVTRRQLLALACSWAAADASSGRPASNGSSSDSEAIDATCWRSRHHAADRRDDARSGAPPFRQNARLQRPGSRSGPAREAGTTSHRRRVERHQTGRHRALARLPHPVGGRRRLRRGHAAAFHPTAAANATSFTPDPAGSRWYHSHNPADRNLQKGHLQRSVRSVRCRRRRRSGSLRPGSADPAPRVGAAVHDRAAPPDVEFRYLLHQREDARRRRTDPRRRRHSECCFASSTPARRCITGWRCRGHLFHVIALDGNAVPVPRRVPILDLGPGERVDAIVEMNRPGVWILGEVRTEQRAAGMGIVVEYADQAGRRRDGSPPGRFVWDYTTFGGRDAAPEPDGRLTMVFQGHGRRASLDDQRQVASAKTDPIVVQANRAVPLASGQSKRRCAPGSPAPSPIRDRARSPVSRCQGSGKTSSSCRRGNRSRWMCPTTQPGLSLFHCHQQFHMDMGFMTMMRYAE